MSADLFNIRHFQTVRDRVRPTGLSPAPLYAQLRQEQRAGRSGNAVVAAAQKLSRQFHDELSPGAA